mgnify:FL=1|tara:strand:- start:7490 stop:8104 length:615 start_codon:yes stop_codon:yes gene_type:complete
MAEIDVNNKEVESKVKPQSNQFDDVGVNPFNAPIPGESLTASPDTPTAWERPPEFTDQEDAMRAVYFELTEQDTLRKLINIISEGVALDEIAQVILYKGYRSGKFNPDMVLLLAEPTIYLLIAIADYAEIKDYVLYEGEQEDDPDTQIPGDDVTPINMDEDDEVVEEKTEPTEEVLGESLLAKVKQELPSKVEAAVEVKEEVEE